MRLRSFGLSMSAGVMLAGAACADEPPGVAGVPVVVEANSASLRSGARCRIETHPRQVGRDETVAVYEGLIAGLSPDGVRLSEAEMKRVVVRQVPPARTPFLDHHFRNVGVGTAADEPEPGDAKQVWLPDGTIRSLKVILPSAESLGAGTRCRIELNPTSSGRDETVVEYEGVVARTSPEGVGLTVAEERVTVVRKTPLARLPYLERFFRNVGISRPGPGAAREVWLPSAAIRSLRLIPAGAASPSDPRVPAPEFPRIEDRPESPGGG